MPPTRRQILLASTGGITAFAGCSILSDPQQSLLVAVNNFTESRQSGQVLIENGGTELVRQYVEIPAAESDTWGTVETRIALGEMPNGTRLDVTASFGDGLTANGPIKMNCSDDYKGEVMYVQITAGLNVRLNDACYDEFPSGEASEGGINQSEGFLVELDGHTTFPVKTNYHQKTGLTIWISDLMFEIGKVVHRERPEPDKICLRQQILSKHTHRVSGEREPARGLKNSYNEFRHRSNKQSST